MSSRHRLPNLHVGDAFVASLDDETPHLWVIVAQHDGRVVLVNLTTARSRVDPAAVFVRGEHPFVKHPSYAYYQGMQEAAAEKLASLLARGVFHRQPRVSPQMLSKLQLGALLSRYTPLKLRRTFEDLAEERRLSDERAKPAPPR